MKLYFSFILAFVFGFYDCVIWAQNPNRQYLNHQWNGKKLTLQTNDGFIEIQFLQNKIIENTFTAKGKTNPDSSHAIVLKPSKVKAKFRETPSLLILSSPHLYVYVQKSPFQIRYDFVGLQSKTLITEKEGYFDRDTLRGFNFNLDTEEALYGTGERALPMNRRGNRLELYNRPHYGYENESRLMGYNVPLVISSKCYGIYFDNAPKAFLDLGKSEQNVLSFESVGGKMTYYIWADDSFDALTDLFTQLTGRQPIPPRWVLGNFASRYGYRNETQTRQTVEEFFKQDIPLSAVVLDHFWYGEGEIKKSVGMGDLDWYAPSFPNAEQMVKDFQTKGVETVLITQPFVLTNSKNFAETSEKRLLATNAEGKTEILPFFYFGETAILDIFKPETQRWFWSKYKYHTQKGITGWWGDLGEPEGHSDDIRHVNGKGIEVHNIYGHYWAKMISEGFAKDFPNKRPFILMRAGFAGSQRFGLIPWSGDVNRSWGGLQPQPSLALNMGLSGLAYMHSDLGGFAGDYRDEELYVRWLQYGVFQPIFRPHAQEAVPAEPVFYEGKTKEIARKMVKLRYQLMPYNYTLAFQNATRGKLLMRPLFFEDAGRKQNWNTADSYFWGDAFLVAPILEKGQKERKIYLPKGNNWYDFHTNQRYEGGQEIVIVANLEQIPVFVKAGSFVPMIPEKNVSNRYSSENLQILFYLDKKGEYLLYEDDGQTPDAFSKKQFETIQFLANQSDNLLIFNLIKSKTTYPNAPKARIIELNIIGLSDEPISFSIKDNKTEQEKTVQFLEEGKIANWDAQKKVYKILFYWVGNRVSIQLNLKKKE